jgi:hypothetical protein
VLRDRGYSIQRGGSRATGSRVFRSQGYSAANPAALAKPPQAFVVKARGTTTFVYQHARSGGGGGDPGVTGTMRPRPWWQLYSRGLGHTQVYAASWATGTGVNRANLNEYDEDDEMVAESVLLGVLGSAVPAIGQDGPAILYEEVVTNALQANYVRLEVLSVTPGYTATVFGDTSFTVIAPQLTGVCEITYKWFIDGVEQAGTGTVTVDFGAFADLLQTDDVDTLAAEVALSWSTSVSASLSVTDAADTLNALFTGPEVQRNAALAVADEDDALTVSAAVVLVPRTVFFYVTEPDDTVAAVALATTESSASLVVTDASDTLVATANMLAVRNATLSITDQVDTTVSLMGTVRSAFESVTLQSPIASSVTLTSYIHGA